MPAVYTAYCGGQGADEKIPGAWVHLPPTQRERAVRGCLTHTCLPNDPPPLGHDQLLHFVPHKCQLPPAVPTAAEAEAIVCETLGNRTLRIVGDSVSKQMYAHLRCYLGLEGPSDPADESVVPDATWVASLVAAGFTPSTANSTVAFFLDAAPQHVPLWRRGLRLGCGSRIDYRRLDSLPHTASSAEAALHALFFLGPERLSRSDIALVNFGLHSDWRPMDASRLRVWWSARQGMAPFLLWRVTSPQHFPGGDGSGKFTAGAEKGSACVAVDDHGGRVQRHVWAAKEPKGLQPWGRLLPVFMPSLSRHDEHPLVGYRERDGTLSGVRVVSPIDNATAARGQDCTHYCQPSSTLRFWVQLLLAYTSHVPTMNTRDKVSG